jgi:hypothetical protein
LKICAASFRQTDPTPKKIIYLRKLFFLLPNIFLLTSFTPTEFFFYYFPLMPSFEMKFFKKKKKYSGEEKKVFADQLFFWG